MLPYLDRELNITATSELLFLMPPLSATVCLPSRPLARPHESMLYPPPGTPTQDEINAFRRSTTPPSTSM